MREALGNLGVGESGEEREFEDVALRSGHAGQRTTHPDGVFARLGSGALVVVEDTCPHDGGLISDGFVEGDLIVCSRHNWELVACNGRCERAR